MNYLGDFAEDQTVYLYFATNNAAGGAVAPLSAFESADVVIYKDGSATQKATANGLTMTSPFDTVTGLHLLAIDTSIDTGDTGFWEAGHDYTVILTPDETVDAQTIVHPLAQFSIENRGPQRHRRAINAIATATVGSGSTTTSVVTSAVSPSAGAADCFKGQILCFDKNTTTAALRNQKARITANTSGATPTITVEASSLTDAPVSTDSFTIQ